jgi:hypothetical protein
MNKEFLEVEASKGEQAQRVWEYHVKPFFDAKNVELYEFFIESNTSSEKDLLLIKLQVNALQSLKDHFYSYITTGQMASKQLEEEKDGH